MTLLLDQKQVDNLEYQRQEEKTFSDKSSAGRTDPDREQPQPRQSDWKKPKVGAIV
jgi:hypothetical protein